MAEPARDCVVLNTEHLHASVYDGMDFNSFATVDGVLYAANENGIYVFDNDADTSFHSGVVLPITYLGSLSSKRVRVCVTDCYGVQPTIRLKAYTAYKDEVQSDSVVVRDKAYFPRTLRGKKFEILVSDFDCLFKMEFFVTILTR